MLIEDYLLKSLKFDLDVLRVRRLPAKVRAAFIVSKYRGLANLAMRRPATIAVGRADFCCESISALGTLQSCIIDLQYEIVRLGLLDAATPEILDIGANIGQFCASAKLMFPDASVTCFEPDPDTFRKLERNTVGLDSVTLVNLGLGNSNTDLAFYRHSLSTMSSFRPPDGDDRRDETQILLPIRRLDELDEVKDKKFDLVKIDVEGLEEEVIRGGSRTLSNAQILIVEIRLSRTKDPSTNLELFSLISSISPTARLVGAGRPLGSPTELVCQDFVFAMR